MKKSRLHLVPLALALLLALSLSAPALALDDPEPNCRAAIVVDGDHDQVLYAHNAYERMYPASVTKIMTSLVVLEAVEAGQLALDTPVTASQEAVTLPENSSTAGILAGEILTVKQLLYCDLLPSANEACNILAEAVAGSVEAFVERMNAKAQELGMGGTHFTNPHGLHDEDHYTTAYDIYLMAKAAMEYETFRTIVSTDTYVLPATNLSEERVLHSTNALLSNWNVIGYTYNKAIGIKTGYTGEAGRCLAAAAVDGEGRTFYSVVLGAEDGYDEQGNYVYYSFYESRRLLEWAFDNFQRTDLLGEDTVNAVRELPVTLSDEADFVLVQPAGSIQATLPTDYDPEQAELIMDLPESVQAPIAAGQELGSVSLIYNGITYGPLPMVAVDGVGRSGFQYAIHLVQTYWSYWWIRIPVILALALLVLFLLYLALLRPRRRRNRRRYSYSGGSRHSHSNYRGRGRR